MSEITNSLFAIMNRLLEITENLNNLFEITNS